MVQIYEGTRLRAGRFAVTAEVVEGADGVSLAELILPDGERVSVGADPVVIGRLPECPIVLADPNVSRRPRRNSPGGRHRGGDRSRIHERDAGERNARPRTGPGEWR